jgi:hypothetical protein
MEKKSTVLAAQDQALSKNYFKEKFWKEKLKVNADCIKHTMELLTT